MGRRRAGRDALSAFGSTAVKSEMITQQPAMKMTTAIPTAVMTRDSVETSIGTLKFFDGMPTTDTVDAVYDWMDRARAAQVYVDTIPVVSTGALRAGGEAVGSKAPHQFLMAKDLLTVKPLVLTANTSTLYTWSFLDLERDGPTIADLPQGMLGVLNDAYFRYIADLDVAAMTRAGRKHLVLPPGHDGEVPDGYFIARSPTNSVWLFMRGYLKGGLEAAVKNVKGSLNAYPLAKADAPPAAESSTARQWSNTRPYRRTTAASTPC